MVRIAPPPLAQYEVDDFDEMQFPGWGRLSGVWAGDVMANDLLIQTEVIADLPGIFIQEVGD